MTQRLIAFGCSNTYGQGLEDCYENIKFPSKLAWPQLLADKLNYECINLSIPGASNALILHSISNFNFKKSDLVLILWSYSERYTQLLSNIEYKSVAPWRTDKISKFFFKNLYNDYDAVIKSLFYITAAQQILITHELEYYFCFCEHREFKKVNSKLPSFIKPVFLETWNLHRHSYPRALDNSHAGPEAQQNYSNMLYNSITNNNNFASFDELINRDC